MDPQPPSATSPDVLGDLLGPLAIEGHQPAATQPVHNLGSGVGVAPNAEDALALAPVEEQTATVQVLLSPTLVNMIYLLAFM